MASALVAVSAICALHPNVAQRSALGRRVVVLGGVGTLMLRSAERTLAALPPPPGLDTSAKYLPRGGPGGLPLSVSKDAGVELLSRARDQMAELIRLAEEGGRQCGDEGLQSVRALIDKGAANVAMEAGLEAYTVVNLKKTALRPALVGKTECDEIQMRQLMQSSIKAIDEMVKIGKSPTPRDKYY